MFSEKRRRFGNESAKTQGFIRQRAREAEPGEPLTVITLGKAAIRLLEEIKESIDDSPDRVTDRNIIGEFSQLFQTYSDSLVASIKKDTLDRRDFVNAKSEFNDALRDIFNRWGGEISPRDVLHTLNNFIPIAKNEKLVRQVKNSIVGVRTEILAELAMENMGLKLDRAEPEQDARGIDYILTMEDGRNICIDIKTSPKAADEANNRNKSYGDDVIAVCPFSKDTLQKFDTILPRDTYGEMLEPSKEMAFRLAEAGVLTSEEYDEITASLNEQIERCNNTERSYA